MFNALTRPPDLRARYNTAAAGWQRKMDALGYLAAYRAAITQLCPQGVIPRRVMDVGCGAGDFAIAYLTVRPRPDVLTLADPAAAMLHAAHARLHGAADQVLLLQAAVGYLPTHPAQDLILCAHVIDHCPDPVHALRMLAQSLAPGGAVILIATKPHWCNWLIRPFWRHRQASCCDGSASRPRPAWVGAVAGP